MFSATNPKTGRAIVWLLVISSLACWEIAAARFQGCSLGTPDLKVCQPIDQYTQGQIDAVAAHKNNHYKSAQPLALTSYTRIISPQKSSYSISVLITQWQSHYDVPPTPPPDLASSTFLA